MRVGLVMPGRVRGIRAGERSDCLKYCNHDRINPSIAEDGATAWMARHDGEPDLGSRALPPGQVSRSRVQRQGETPRNSTGVALADGAGALNASTISEP